jgi:hypothetical protein
MWGKALETRGLFELKHMIANNKKGIMAGALSAISMIVFKRKRSARAP